MQSLSRGTSHLRLGTQMHVYLLLLTIAVYFHSFTWIQQLSHVPGLTVTIYDITIPQISLCFSLSYYLNATYKQMCTFA